MKYKKTIILLALVVFLLSIAGVSASEIGDTITSENANTIELSADNDIGDNLQTSEENEALASTDYDEDIAQTDTEVLGADSAKYSDLANEISQPGNINLTHKNYTYDGGETIAISEDNKVIDGNGAVIDMNGSTIRAFYISASGVTIKNLTIKNAKYNGGDGGAIYFTSSGTVSNCNFTGNTASEEGGAVYFFDQGTVSNCNFTGNTASVGGGAVFFYDEGTVTNCNFADNSASSGGGAIFFVNTGTVTNCNFVDNSASRGGAIYSVKWYTTADTCIFKRNSGDNVNTVIYPPTLNVNNFTTVYGSGEKLTFDLKTNSSIPVTNGNISISVYFKDNGVWVRNYTCLSGEGWIPDLPVGSYIAFFDTEYAEFQEINRTVTITLPNVRYSINVTSLATNNKTVNITAKSDIPKNILWDGKLLFILPNSTEINATYGGNGTWWAMHKFADYSVYQINATYEGLDNVTITNGTISISKTPTNITVENETLELFVKDYIATGATLTPADAGNVTYTVSNSSVVEVKDGIIEAVGEGSAIITVSFTGSDDYAAAENKTISVTVSLKNASVSVNNATLDLLIGDEFIIVATTTPEGLDVSFTPDNSSVISVDDSGIVTALKEGNATVKVKVGGDGVYALNTTDVTVTVKKIPTNITVENATLELYVEDSIATGATLIPADAGNVTYTVSNSSVVEVKDGIIEAVGEGSAIITVSFTGSDDYAAAENKTISVTVSLKNASVSVNNATLDLLIGDEFIIVTTTDPKGLDVTFTPDNSGVVIVDENGVVTALKEGNATVKVSVGDDGVYAENSTTITVTVNKINTTADVSIPENITVGDNSTVNVVLPGDAKGNVTVKVDGEVVDTVPVKYGSAEVTIPSMSAGNHTVEIAYSGDGKYNPVDETKEITVSKKDTTPEIAIPSDIEYGDNATVDVKLPSDATGNVTLTVDGKIIDTVPVTNGNASVKLPTLDVGNHTAEIAYSGDDKYKPASKTATISIGKDSTKIAAADVTATFKVNKYLVITLKDSKGNPLANAKVTVELSTAKNYTTDEKGQIKVKVSNLVPKTYSAKIKFAGNDNYLGSDATAKVVVKKATPKLTAKAKTFKTTTKTKKYTITLKNKNGKGIRNAQLTLKVNGKTYKATTNSKGKATFKITQINKKGTFKATVTFKGSKYYKKVTKKVSIKVKSVWKTVSKGSKKKAIVKKIQRALKNHGYYLTYNGRYLKVDGIFWDYTKMAVKQFQNAKTLKVTGKVDEKTAKKLGII